MKTIRCFLAIDLNLATARALADFQRGLAERCRLAGARVSWVAPQNLHVTVAFLGQITEPMSTSLASVLEPAAAASAPFDMPCAGLGAFPEDGPPRVIWVGVADGGGQLEALHGHVLRILGETGFGLEGRPLKSHVTIGRIREDGAAAVRACLAEEAPGPFGETRVADLACYRSDLHPKGADYHLLWRLPLTGRTSATGRQPKE
jgi:2'-5' RNA ligase